MTDALPAVRSATVHRAWAADLPAATLYAILRLRVGVFVVEQACAYAELDGRDLEPQTRHYWLDVPTAGEPDLPEILGCVRLLAEPGGGFRIGRLCTAAAVRGRGLGRRLMAAVLAEVGGGACVLEAQTHAADFYRGYGFEHVGEPYDWDGVEHVTMRRRAA
ncbi:MAG: GNAT family N-acetyltransferase [Pseudonocardia sp.]